MRIPMGFGRVTVVLWRATESLIFGVHPMLLSLFFSCPADFPHLEPGDFPSTKPFATMTTPEPLRCPNATQLAAVRQAIADGAIVLQGAFPVSAEPEMYSGPVFSAGLELVTELARSMNVSRPRTLSQRDVPGLTRAVVPLLAKSGVHSISIGANGGSAAPDLPGYTSSREATLSTPFVWKDTASGSSIVAHWHPGGCKQKGTRSRFAALSISLNLGSITISDGRLGSTESGEGVISSCIGTTALPGKAMCLGFRGDNAGPPQPEVTSKPVRLACEHGWFFA